MNIGLLGFGVVGRGVYDMLAGRDDIRAAWVLCRRDLGELTARTTYEMQDILDDPAVDTVVEVMGGLHPAYEYVAAALRAGKNVVSSNKYLMCRYYDELTALAKEHGAALRCTAAVGGGIPWLTNLEKAANANHISRVWGILNGTTNYIMDAMHGSDVDFADVLAQAQALGYAEADPSADIDGLDIQRKLILSANVAFGVSLREADVPVFGIRNVRKADIARFQAHGCTCKLIATAEQKAAASAPTSSRRCLAMTRSRRPCPRTSTSSAWRATAWACRASSVRARAATRRPTTSCRISWTSAAACMHFTPTRSFQPYRTIPVCSTATTCARAPHCRSWPPSPRATGTVRSSRSPCP